MKNNQIMLLCSMLATFSAPVLANDDIAVGKQKSVICASCHGNNGVSNSPLWPNLAGQKGAYIEKQLKDFRSGARQDPMMGAMANPLSDADIKALASYYASLKP